MKWIIIINFIISGLLFLIIKVIINEKLRKDRPDEYKLTEIVSKSGLSRPSKYYYTFLYNIRDEADVNMRKLKKINIFTFPYILVSFILIMIISD